MTERAALVPRTTDQKRCIQPNFARVVSPFGSQKTSDSGLSRRGFFKDVLGPTSMKPMSRASARDGNEAHRVHVDEKSRRRDVSSHSGAPAAAAASIRREDNISVGAVGTKSAPLLQLIRTQCCAVGQACERWEQKDARRWRARDDEIWRRVTLDLLGAPRTFDY